MGCSCSITLKEETKPVTPINIQMFIINGLIGEGGFGKVMTALFVKNNNWYAVKEIKKVILRIRMSMNKH
jgi:serine/threonine protein kinase